MKDILDILKAFLADEEDALKHSSQSCSYRDLRNGKIIAYKEAIELIQDQVKRGDK